MKEAERVWMGALEGAVTWVNLRVWGITMLAGGAWPRRRPGRIAWPTASVNVDDSVN